MKNIIYLVFILALVGCATAGSNVGYSKFHDSNGEYKLVTKGNDLYLERLDGSGSRRITNTPDIKEYGVIFVQEGKYLVYSESTAWSGHFDKHYIQKTTDDDAGRREISNDEWTHYAIPKK